MVMIVFKPKENMCADISMQKVDDYEAYGRSLWAEYAYKCEQLMIDANACSGKTICQTALGIILADYRFYKYNTMKSEEYPKLEAIVFFTDKFGKAQKEFEDYAALANAIRFTKDLYNEPDGQYQLEQYFFEIKRLEYLGLRFKDCGGNLLRLVWKGSDNSTEKIIVAENRQKSAIAAGVMKVIALQRLPINITVYLKIDEAINDLLVKNPIYITDNIYNETQVEKELRRVYNLIREI